MCPPCRPKMRSMPRLLRNRATQAAQASWSALGSCVASGSVMTLPFGASRVRSASAALLPRAQQPMLNLAGGRARHLLVADEAHRTRTFISGDAAAAPLDDFDLGRSGSIARNDHRMHPLTPRRIGDADHRDVPDLLVRAEQRLDFGRVDV